MTHFYKRLFSLEIRWVNHLLFWLFIISLFTFLPGLYLEIPLSRILLYNLLYTPGDIFAVYITLYFLMPRFLLRKKPWYFFLGLIAISILIYGQCRLIQKYIEPWLGFDFIYDHWLREFIDSFTMLFFIVGMATVLRFLRHYYQLRLKNIELEKINLQSELTILKSQVTPHFLFNVLNNIDELVYQDTDKASQALLSFSNLLRNLFRNISEDLVPIEQELQQANDYISLVTMGHPSDQLVSVTVEGSSAGRMIAPMLFMPLIENAFKYADRKAAQPAIRFTVNMDEDGVSLKTFNHVRKISNPGEEKGTGLKNLRKRLELIYPGKHILDLRNEGTTFQVFLYIRLS
jgi:hypothetical protein